MEQASSPSRPSAVELSSSPSRLRRPSNSQAGPSGARKRRRLTNQTVSSSASLPENTETIEAIDLTDADGHSAIAKVLAKQREDAVAAQLPGGSGNARTKLIGYKCPVCMDTLTDATTTVCGHLFCHQCITEALKIGEERADNAGKTAKGTCPVCRKPLARQDSPGQRRNLVPLQIKLTTKKRATEAV